jgi:hypothetical protein
MSLSPDGSYAVPVSGPSARLAWLRALWVKAQHVATTAWARTRLALSAAVRIPKAVATAAVTALSTTIGYTAVVTTVATTVRTVGRAVGAGVRTVGRGLSWLGRTITDLVGKASPSAAEWLSRTARRVADPVRDAVQRVGGLLSGVGTVAEHLAHMPLVRTASTTAAKITAGVLAVHAISKGAVAAKIVAAVPASMDLVVAATNPWVALAGVGVVTVGAMGIALARLMSARPGTDEDPEDDTGPDDTPPSGGVTAPAVTRPTVDPAESEAEVEDILTDLAEIAKTVQVVIDTDGSVVVEGIPTSVPGDLREVVAQIAADGAIRHVERTLRVRPTPSRDDRRLFTKAAREALVSEARRRKEGPEQQAA